MRHHADLLDAAFWQNHQSRIRAGPVFACFPYEQDKRFCQTTGPGRVLNTKLQQFIYPSRTIHAGFHRHSWRSTHAHGRIQGDFTSLAARPGRRSHQEPPLSARV
jgi:hypothetical protein